MSDGFDGVFAELREIMLRAGEGMTVARDEPGDLELRTPHIDAKTGKPGWFGTVTKKKAYVAFHLMPLYTDPVLASSISPALTVRRHGKTCFNFKTSDPVMFAELESLTARALIPSKAP